MVASDAIAPERPETRVAVLISGRGSNLKALIEHQQGYQVVAVASNKPKAGGLAITRQHSIPAIIVDHRRFQNRVDFEIKILEALAEYRPEIVVFAGFMRVMTPKFVHAYQGKLINLHPSLLPKFPGLHPHRQALEAGENEHGATIHFVSSELDAGPIIARWSLPVRPEETLKTLTERTRKIEHLLLPQTLSLLAQGQVEMEGSHVLFKGLRLPRQGMTLTQLWGGSDKMPRPEA